MIARYASCFSLLAGLLGCEPAREVPQEEPGSAVTPFQEPTVLFLGTSLTAGLGLDPDQAYPALIQQKIDSAALGYRVVNAGVSGETSAGARRRVDWLFQQPVSVLVLETGANDGLRGLPPEALRSNIQAILDRAREQNPDPTIVLLGMQVPPNYGREYSRRFQEVYSDLAQANGLALVPFLLDGVGGVTRLNQPDGIHPTAEGQRKMAETVWQVLGPLLEREKRERTHNTSARASRAVSISSSVL